MSDFFGRVYSDVIRNPNLPTTAKAIYAYLSVLCGAGNECYPSVTTICSELAISRDTFYKYSNLLVSAGVISKRQELSKSGRFSHVVYTLLKPCVNLSDTENTAHDKSGHTVSEKTGLPYAEKSYAKYKYQKELPNKKASNRNKSTHNFQQREDIDYEELQRQLLLKSYRGKSEV